MLAARCWWFWQWMQRIPKHVHASSCLRSALSVAFFLFLLACNVTAFSSSLPFYIFLSSPLHNAKPTSLATCQCANLQCLSSSLYSLQYTVISQCNSETAVCLVRRKWCLPFRIHQCSSIMRIFGLARVTGEPMCIFTIASRNSRRKR